MKNILTAVGIAFGFVLLSGPALAGTTPLSVPEPVSLSLLAGGIVAIAAVKRMRRK